VEIETLILHSSWKFIGLKTFFFLVTLLWKIPGKIRSFQPDVILFSSMVTAGVLPFFIKKLRVPCVTINHGQDVTLPVSIYQWYLAVCV
jgi:phosphatidyl-myo-inositol dimannoside synthase